MASRGSAGLESEDYLLLGAIVTLPWAFGGVEAWAHRVAGLAIVGAAAIVVRKQGLPALIGPLRQRWLLPAVFLAGWAALQLVPLPPGLVRRISPQTHRIHSMSEGLSLAVDTTAGEPSAADRPSVCPTLRPLSLVPQSTRDRLFWYVPLLLAFVLLRQRLAERHRRRIYRALLFVSFSGLACFALIQAATWNGKLFWMRPLLSNAHPFGPYLNPVHFAGLMELAVPVMLGFAWACARRSDSLFALLRDPRFVWTAIGALLCASAGIASSSKAALVLIPGAGLCLVLVGLRSNRDRLIAACTTVIVGIGCVVFLSGTPVFDRAVSYAQRTQPGHWMEGRGAIWGGGLELLAAFPISGSGFGTFREVFPRYQPAGSQRRWAQAHNDYLESLTDGGLVTGIAIVLLFGSVATRLVRGLRGRHERISVRSAGLTIGLATLGLHAAIDFNHQIPANALAFVTVCALALQDRWSPALRSTERPAWISIGLAAAVLVFAFHAVMGGIAGLHFASGQPLIDPQHPHPLLVRIAAMQTDPLASLYERASIELEQWDTQAEAGAAAADPRLLADAKLAYVQALCRSPAAWQPWVGLSYVEQRRERSDAESRPDRRDVPGPAGRSAIEMMRNAAARAPNWYVVHDQLALALWDYGLREESLEAVRASAAALPFYWQHSFGRDADTSDEFLAAFAEGSWEAIGRVPLVPRVDQLVALGKLERLRGEDERAEAAFDLARAERGDALDRAEIAYHLGSIATDRLAYDQARPLLEQASRHPRFRGSALRQLALAAEASGDADRSLELLRTISREEPENLELCLQLADLARRNQRWPVALDALFRADALRPEDPGASTALVETYLTMGDAGAARLQLVEHRLRHPNDPDLERLTQALAVAESPGS